MSGTHRAPSRRCQKGRSSVHPDGVTADVVQCWVRQGAGCCDAAGGTRGFGRRAGTRRGRRRGGVRPSCSPAPARRAPSAAPPASRRRRRARRDLRGRARAAVARSCTGFPTSTSTTWWCGSDRCRPTSRAGWRTAGARITRSVAGTRWTELATPNQRRAPGAGRAAARSGDRAGRRTPTSAARADAAQRSAVVGQAEQLPLAAAARPRVGHQQGQRRHGRGHRHRAPTSTIPISPVSWSPAATCSHPASAPQDDNGHGTMTRHRRGADEQHRGVVGIAPSAKVMPIKVLDSNGSGSDADIAVGIDWARTHGAKVINLSLGGSFDDPVLADAVQNAIAANIVVVAAAGNDGTETVGFPASYPGRDRGGRDRQHGRAHVVLELRLARRRRRAGPRHHVDRARQRRRLPDRVGDVVLVADRGRGRGAGAGASIRAGRRRRSPIQIRDTARDIGLPGVDPAFGHGIVDPLAALGGPAAAPHPSAPRSAPTNRTTRPPTRPRWRSAASRTRARSRPRPTRTGTASLRRRRAGTRCTSRSGAAALDHAMDPLVELYKPDHSFAASQELAGGDLVVQDHGHRRTTSCGCAT